MAAGVHFPRCLRGVIDLVFLKDRQRIHISAVHDCWAVVIAFEHGYDPRFSHPGLDFQPQTVQFLGDDTRSAHFLKRQFGVSMKIPATRHKLVT